MISSYDFILLFAMTIVGAFAGLYLKKASGASTIKSFFKSHYVYTGGVLYIFSAVLNILLLKHMKLSLILPLTSITYIWTLIIAHYYLGEKISKRKIIGVIIIIVGVVVLVQ